MIERVTAFITRRINGKPQLLVFKHPVAGIQIPSGTVEENEALEKALFRAVNEETGLKKITLTRKLGETTNFLGPDEAILTQTMRFFAWPAQSAKRNGPLCTRGLKLQTFERKVGFVRVKYEEFDLNKQAPVLLSELEGWLPSNVLTREVHQHFYLLKMEEDTADHWNIQSDGGNTFQCMWVNMDDIPVLNGEQSEWLKQLDGISPEEI